MAFRILLVLLALSLALLAYGLHTRILVVPDEFNPWAPLRIEQPVHWLTGFKLDRAARDASVCLATLSQAQMRYQPLEDREAGAGCGWRNAVRVHATSAAVGESFSLSCRSALSLAMWERHVMQPAAERHFGSRVKRVEHYGSYACRPIYGREGAPLSRHASADALDLAGFVLADGRTVRVQRDWGGEDADALFLRELRDGACRMFDGVLGPDYNAAHSNHFHFERGGGRICR